MQRPGDTGISYTPVTSVVNSSELRLKVDRKQKRAVFLRNDVAVGQWNLDVLETRLQKQHSEAVFVAAAIRGQGRDKEFHDRTVTYCALRSMERFIDLIE